MTCASIIGCALRVQPESQEFDTLYGKGPVLIAPTDETVPSTAFFRKNWISSPAIQHLVTQRGTPEAISIEREFLQPNRLRLFYPAQGQVYLLDQIGGEWLVAGSVPLDNRDLDLLAMQRLRRIQSSQTENLGYELQPKKVTTRPLAAAQQTEFRGMLKPPSKARVARLTRKRDGSLLHTVTFEREDLAVIADWYTGDFSNAADLAQLNRRTHSGRLTIGDQIVIPRRLIENIDPLPEAVVP